MRNCPAFIGSIRPPDAHYDRDVLSGLSHQKLERFIEILAGQQSPHDLVSREPADLFAQALVQYAPRHLKFGENVEFVDNRIAFGKFDGVTIAKRDIVDDLLVYSYTK